MEHVDNKYKKNKRTKLYTISMVIIISILLVGFIFMSLILIDILKVVNGFASDFIEFVRGFFNEREINYFFFLDKDYF